MNYRIAPPDWNPKTSPNPFTSDGVYGPNWICFHVAESASGISCGAHKDAVFTMGTSMDTEGVETTFADFLRYAERHARNVILRLPEGVDAEPFVQRALSLTLEDNAVRAGDPRWAVHSTNLRAWEYIKKDGGLKALSVLRREGIHVLSVGFDQLHEPPEFADYVCLGKIDGIGAEHVVASQRKGRIWTEEDDPYEPGIRLYFDNHKIIESGLGVRDGLHLIKVDSFLPLDPFLVSTVSVEDVDLPDEAEAWTPRSFLEAANAEFQKRLT